MVWLRYLIFVAIVEVRLLISDGPVVMVKSAMAVRSSVAPSMFFRLILWWFLIFSLIQFAFSMGNHAAIGVMRR